MFVHFAEIVKKKREKKKLGYFLYFYSPVTQYWFSPSFKVSNRCLASDPCSVDRS